MAAKKRKRRPPKRRAPKRRAPKRTRRRRSWASLPHSELLDVRLCDLGVRIEGTELAQRVRQLNDELADKGLRLRPHCWLSSEWFSPTGIPGIAIPFYLAHPRLKKLEALMMLEVEGGNKTWCMQLLRHEAGHAMEVAYRLHRRAAWRKVFGAASKAYPEYYRPKPFSRDFVQHLDWWYAQSHPTEDFAETFAVWLKPGTRWRQQYRGWPALEKLEFVDELMQDLAGQRPLVRSKRRVDPLHELTITLREHYTEKQERYGLDYPDFYIKDLMRLFDHAGSRTGTGESAAAFLRREGPGLRSLVATWTGEPAYTINLAMREMVAQSRQLKLRVSKPKQQMRLEVAVLLTMLTMNYVYSSDHRIPV